MVFPGNAAPSRVPRSPSILPAPAGCWCFLHVGSNRAYCQALSADATSGYDFRASRWPPPGHVPCPGRRLGGHWGSASSPSHFHLRGNCLFQAPKTLQVPGSLARWRRGRRGHPLRPHGRWEPGGTSQADPSRLPCHEGSQRGSGRSCPRRSWSHLCVGQGRALLCSLALQNWAAPDCPGWFYALCCGSSLLWQLYQQDPIIVQRVFPLGQSRSAPGLHTLLLFRATSIDQFVSPFQL